MKASSTTAAPKRKRPKPPVVPDGGTVEMVPLSRIRPARVNDTVYKPVVTDDPAIVALGVADE